MMRLIVTVVVLFGLTGCVALQKTPPIPVNDNRFDGLWKGSGTLHKIQASGWTCSGKEKTIYFRVKDRVATSLIDHPSTKFSVQVSESGNISFEYVGTVTENGVPKNLGTQFWGKLGSDSGGGDYRFLQCYGDWAVSKIAGARNSRQPDSSPPQSGSVKREEIQANAYQKPYIIIQSDDVVQAGGIPKFKVKPGDVLEIVHDKTCLNGVGVCFKVRNPDTGEWGFVTENRMESRHDIVR